MYKHTEIYISLYMCVYVSYICKYVYNLVIFLPW